MLKPEVVISPGNRYAINLNLDEFIAFVNQMKTDQHVLIVAIYGNLKEAIMLHAKNSLLLFHTMSDYNFAATICNN